MGIGFLLDRAGAPLTVGLAGLALCCGNFVVAFASVSSPDLLVLGGVATGIGGGRQDHTQLH